MVNLRGCFVVLAAIVIGTVLVEGCPLHMCYNCTVFCAAASPVLVPDITQAECIGLLNETITAVEYVGKSAGSGTCYTSSTNNGCVTYDFNRLGGVAITPRCNTEGCTSYAVTGKKGLTVSEVSPTSDFPAQYDLCITFSIMMNFLVFDFHPSWCYLYNDCGENHSCSYNETDDYVITFNRTCLQLCHFPADPENGVAYVEPAPYIIFGETATYECNFGFSLNGSVYTTCQADGTWYPEPPSCMPSTTTSTTLTTTTATTTATSTAATTLTTTTAETTTSTIAPTTTVTSTTTTMTTTAPTTTVTRGASTTRTASSAVDTQTTTPSSMDPIITRIPQNSGDGTTTLSPSTTDATTQAAGTSTADEGTTTQQPTVCEVCPCLCESQDLSPNMTVNTTSDPLLENVIDPKLTSMARRKLVSVPDHRLSAQVLGLSGAAILMSFFVVCVSCDVFKFFFKWHVEVKKK